MSGSVLGCWGAGVQAHWFYEDNVREEHGGLKSLSLREFAVQMFTQCSILKKYTVRKAPRCRARCIKSRPILGTARKCTA